MSNGMQKLIEVMAKLRDPQTGCAWDLEQTFATIAPHTLEEIYELVEAIETKDIKNIKEELGDVLFQTVFYAQIAQDDDLFTLDDVARDTAQKMIDRHPHVFGDREVHSANDVVTNWEADKETKRQAQARAEGRAASVLDGVSTALPGTTRAVKLQNRASRVGFDWTELSDVVAKIHEELGELEAEINRRATKDFLEDELGDVLFAVVNLARKLDLDPELALRRTNRKFERRFRGIEVALAQSGRSITNASLDEMERLWNEIKVKERAAG